MKKEQPGQTRKAIYFPIGGLLSLVIGGILLNSVPQVDHPSEPNKQMFWEVMTILFLIHFPFILCINSFFIVVNELGPEETRIRTYSLLLTALLCAILSYGVLMFLWEISINI